MYGGVAQTMRTHCGADARAEYMFVGAGRQKIGYIGRGDRDQHFSPPFLISPKNERAALIFCAG